MLNLNNLIKKLIFFSFLIYLPLKLTGQVQTIELDDSYNKLSWNDFIQKVENNYKIKFYFNPDSLDNFEIIVPISKDATFEDNLNTILKPYGYKAYRDNFGNVFVSQDKIITKLSDDFYKQQINNEYVDYNPEKENSFLKTDNIFVGKSRVVGRKGNDNKTNATIFGYIKSSNDNSPIVGGAIQVKETGKVVSTDGNGFYSLKIRKGSYTIIITSLDSKVEKLKLKVLSDGQLDIVLEPKLIALDEVIVSSEKDHIVRSTNMGYQKLEPKKIKEIPLVLGESDVIKISLLLPGVQSIGEGSSGFNVRGSPTDQNLFLINDVPVYNSSHLFGFFSAFNSDAIKDFTLYKSNIPANFGGRLSSIFDVSTKKGNKQEFSASGGISPVTARLLVEGPIKKNSSSYLVGVRSTYSDWLLKQVEDPNIANSNAQFADMVTNFSFDLNEKNQLNIFSYHSYDKMNLISKNEYSYTNNGGSIGWDRLINKKHNLNVSLIYSQYSFDEENSELPIAAYKDNFDLKHSEFKTSLTLRPNTQHTITAGLSSAFYMLDQGNFLPLNDESLVVPIDLGKEQALESSAFISDEWTVSYRLSIIAGVRYNSYLYLGPNDVKLYADDEIKSLENIVDTVSYSKNKIIESYSAPDIRVAARYILNDNLSVKFSFNQLKQYLLMLSNTIAISPTDKWKLSDSNIKPMDGNQYSLGIYSSVYSGKYDFSVETYYKTVNNLLEYKNGANLVVNETPEIDVLQGILNTYGAEFMIKKTFGKFNGWINYTYSRSFVTVDSKHEEEKVNSGEAYPSNYDKPHALNLVANYKFSRRLSISSNVVYSTGRPITYPVGNYFQGNLRLPLYSKRNEYRIPDYFRVDFSLKLEGTLASKKFAHSMWIFSVYNLTGRKNAYSVYFKTEEEGLKGYKLSIFGAPIVSLTYSFKLGNYAK